MRMWQVNPKILCQKHLCGEWREIFTCAGIIKYKKSVEGYFKSNCLEPLSITTRHDELKAEMLRRGYKAKDEWTYTDDMSNHLGEKKNIKIDRVDALNRLLTRCPECKKRFLSLEYGGNIN